MPNYYIKVLIEYVDYCNMERRKVKVMREFKEPQNNANEAIRLCVDYFYEKNASADIISVEVLENALYQ